MERMKLEPTHIDRETGIPFRYSGPPCCPYCGHGLPVEDGGIPTVEHFPEAAQIATEGTDDAATG